MADQCVGDERRHAFFVVDNVVVLEHAAQIGSHALALYVILACHARADTGACYPSIRRLMQLMGRSRPVVFEALRVLQEHKLVRVEQRRSENGGLTSNLYTLLPVGGVAERLVNSVDEGGKEIVPGVGSIVDEGGQAVAPRVVSGADEGGQQNCHPLVNIVYSEQDEVLNYTNLNKTHSNQTNLSRCAHTGHTPRMSRAGRERMVRPSEVEIAEFFHGGGSTSGEARRFWNFYESKGWLVGRTPMRDWRAAARNWMGRDRAAGGSRLAELSARNEARLEAMRARGALPARGIV